MLPSIEEMERDTQQDMSLRKSMGLSERHFHKMVTNLFIDYSDKLATIANIKPFTPVFRQLHKDLEVFRNQDLVRYKDMNFKILSDTQYVIINK